MPMLSVEKFRVGERVVWIGVIFSGRVQGGIAFAFDRGGTLMKRIRALAEHLEKRGVSISLDVQPSDYPEKVFKVLIGELDNASFLRELSFEGVTPFEKKVYEWLTKNVKRGSVITYGDLAKRSTRPPAGSWWGGNEEKPVSNRCSLSPGRRQRRHWLLQLRD